jgi:elongation factor Ts
LVTISAETVRELRDRTGAGVLDCKKVLEEANGDIDRAAELLRQRGYEVAAKKAGRETGQGIIEAYVHGGRIGVLVELNCETDFVARTEDFRNLARELVLQIASMNPIHVSIEDAPEGSVSEPESTVLLEQPWIRDPSRKISDLVRDTIAKTGENVRVRRFARFEMGKDYSTVA